MVISERTVEQQASGLPIVFESHLKRYNHRGVITAIEAAMIVITVLWVQFCRSNRVVEPLSLDISWINCRGVISSGGVAHVQDVQLAVAMRFSKHIDHPGTV